MNFDKAKHEYTDNGVRYPSVTELLPPQNFFCSPGELERSREEGEDDHSLVKMYFDTGIAGNDRLKALDQFINDNSNMLGELVLYEKPLFSKKNLFAGKPDAVFEKAIIDFKRTPGKSNYHALQLAGYNILAHENGFIRSTRIWLICWFDGKKYSAKNVYNQMAESIFLSLVMRHKIDDAVDNYFKIV